MRCVAKQQHKQSRGALGASQVAAKQVCVDISRGPRGLPLNQAGKWEHTGGGIQTSCSQAAAPSCVVQYQNRHMHEALAEGSICAVSVADSLCKPRGLSFGVEQQQVGPTQDTDAEA